MIGELPLPLLALPRELELLCVRLTSGLGFRGVNGNRSINARHRYTNDFVGRTGGEHGVGGLECGWSEERPVGERRPGPLLLVICRRRALEKPSEVIGLDELRRL